MNIEKRAYKFNASRTEVLSLVSGIESNSLLKGKWVDDNNFWVWQKNLSLFRIEGNIDEIESSNKLSIVITANYKFLLFFILPVSLVLFGIYKKIQEAENGWLLILGGISLATFIFLISALLADNLKKKFKEAFQIM